MKYDHPIFKRETVREWRNKYRELFQDMLISSNDSHETTPMMSPGQGRPSLLSEELTTEVKVILNNLRTSGCAISRNVVISVGNGVLVVKCPGKMGGNGVLLAKCPEKMGEMVSYLQSAPRRWGGGGGGWCPTCKVPREDGGEMVSYLQTAPRRWGEMVSYLHSAPRIWGTMEETLLWS